MVWANNINGFWPSNNLRDISRTIFIGLSISSRMNHHQLPKLLFLGSVSAIRDSGYYSCAAVSESGSILTRAEVNVAKEADRPPPIIQLGPVNQTLPIRTVASLPCQASGTHEIITWLKDGVPLSTLDDRRHVIDSDNTLSIKSKHNMKIDQDPI